MFAFPRIITYFSLIVTVIFLLMTADAGAGIKKEMAKSFTVSPGGELILESDIGSVEILTGAQNIVEIEAVLEADTRDEAKAERIFQDFELDFSQEGGDVIITGDYAGSRKGWRFWEDGKRSLKVHFLITVPSRYDVTITTSGGSIAVDDLDGDVKARTSGGSLVFEEIKGEVQGETSGGSIRLSGCVGTADVHTSGGSITIGRVEGEVIARTSGGSIDVDEVLGAIDAETSGGSVSARISKQPTHDCRLVTSGGSVNVHLAEGIGLEVDAQTSGGRVYTQFPVSLRGDLSKSRLRAEVNDGGPGLFLRTSGGNINLNSL